MMTKVASSTRLPYFMKLSIFKVMICKTNLSKHSTGIVPQTQRSEITNDAAGIYQAKLLSSHTHFLCRNFLPHSMAILFSGALATNSNDSCLFSNSHRTPESRDGLMVMLPAAKLDNLVPCTW